MANSSGCQSSIRIWCLDIISMYNARLGRALVWRQDFLSSILSALLLDSQNGMEQQDVRWGVRLRKYDELMSPLNGRVHPGKPTLICLDNILDLRMGRIDARETWIPLWLATLALLFAFSPRDLYTASNNATLFIDIEIVSVRQGLIEPERLKLLQVAT